MLFSKLRPLTTGLNRGHRAAAVQRVLARGQTVATLYHACLANDIDAPVTSPRCHPVLSGKTGCPQHAAYQKTRQYSRSPLTNHGGKSCLGHCASVRGSLHTISPGRCHRRSPVAPPSPGHMSGMTRKRTGSALRRRKVDDAII